jgi:hypothetical protein
MVLLQHELPDASVHFDWLIEPVVPVSPRSPTQAPDPDERCLLSFRVMDRIDRPSVEAFPADPLPPHRRHYLTFEGQLARKHGQPRGTVRRVARGEVFELSATPTLVVVVARFLGRDKLTWSGTPEGDLWTFRRESRQPALKRDPREQAYWRDDLDRAGGEA